jgi:hypothetical protein
MGRNVLAVVALAVACIAQFLAPVVALAQASDVSELGWIEGCWGADGRDVGSGEYWVLTERNELVGVGRIVSNGQTESYEFMRIHPVGEALAFTAQPGCDQETSFMLVNQDGDAVTFENALHDFPQRISYRRVGENRLIARIEGLRDGELRSLEFPMTRQACEVLAAAPGGGER